MQCPAPQTVENALSLASTDAIITQVHGLGGGSRKTWSDSPDQSSFWPQGWLPAENGFKHVRIHSYGYNSDWASQTKSQLTIHDFGQALLADVHNSPELRRNGNVRPYPALDQASQRPVNSSHDLPNVQTPIIFMAHSMGGLVVKKVSCYPYSCQTENHSLFRLLCFSLRRPASSSLGILPRAAAACKEGKD